MAMPSLLIKCPSCGRRFRVKHTGETLEKTEVRPETITTVEPFESPGVLGGQEPGERVEGIDIEPGGGGFVEEKGQVEVEEDTYLESYVCKHCGYKWTQEVTKHKTLES